MTNNTDFAALPVTAVNRPALPRIRYAADDYDTVRTRLRARLPEVLPGWNAALADQGADSGTVLLEIFAQILATFDAYADFRANESYLRTAALTRSLIDLATLIDYRLGRGASSSALQAFLAKPQKTGSVPAGFKLNAQPDPRSAALVFETAAALDVDAGRNQMRVVGFDQSSRILRLAAATTATQDVVANMDASYTGLKAGVPVVLDNAGELLALTPAAVTTVAGSTQLAWPAGAAGVDRELPIANLTLHSRPQQSAGLLAAARADEITLGTNRLPVANASMFTVGGAVLIDSVGLRLGATVLAKNVEADIGPAGSISLNRGVSATLRRSATRVLEGTSCGSTTSTVRAGTTVLARESLSGKKKDFPYTPDPGDLLLIVDASGVELATVAQAAGWQITLTQALPRALRPTTHAFAPGDSPTVRYFMVKPDDPATHQTTLRPVLLGELTGVYASGITLLQLDKSVDALAAGSVVAVSDGQIVGAYSVLDAASVDSRTVLTLAGTVPEALRVVSLTVYGAFEHAMHVAGFNHAEAQLAPGLSQLDLVDQPPGLAAGQSIVLADGVAVEGARLAQVQRLADRTRVALAQPLEHGFALGDLIIYGNVAEISHGAGAPDEVLGSGNPALAPQRFVLRRTPLALLANPASADGVSAALEVFVDGERWQAVDTLAGSGPLDRHYMIEFDENDRAAIRFGDGSLGAAPRSGRNNIVARYRIGRGASGNVAVALIKSMPQALPFIARSFNPAAASGGAEPDSAESTRRRAGRQLHTLDRAVSLADYANLASSFAGVAQARADSERHGRGAAARRVIVVTCAAVGGVALSAPQKEALLAFLQRRSAEPQRLVIRDHRDWPVRLALNVQVLPDFRQAAVQRTVLTTFGHGEGGFFAFDRRRFGEALALSDVYALAESLTGVDHVLATALHPEATAGEVADRIAVPADAIVTGGDASDPAIGRLTVQMLGGLA